MATILLNSKADSMDTIITKGEVQFEHSAEYDESNDSWVDGGIVGVLATHTYCDDIRSIETDRFLIPDCTVVKEKFGSADFLIAYTFFAEQAIIKDDPTSAKRIKEIESKLYGYEETDGFLYNIGNDEIRSKASDEEKD